MSRPLLTTGRVVAVVVLALAVALAVLWYVDRGAEVVAETSESRTIEYDGVRVEIPGSWERLDQSDCEFEFEVWAPPGTPPCSWSRGVAFYGSATFDPAHRPGIRRDGEPGEARWSGYTYAGDYAVYVGDDSRAVVRRILASAGPRSDG